MPLTALQKEVATQLAQNRSEDSYLAGGAALHFEPNSTRFSNDLDYFHDSEERVASAFADDRALLGDLGFSVDIEMNQPGYIRALVRRGPEATKVEWAHDSAWRFLPTVEHPSLGFVLHPVDLAISKVLTLAGRDEARDFLDVLELHASTLGLGALCWAAAGKDPGFTPLSLLALLRRRGRYRPEDFARLRLVEQPDLTALKTTWLDALETAEVFVRSRPPEEIGCLYWDAAGQQFVQPAPGDDVVVHHGRPGGVVPRILES